MCHLYPYKNVKLLRKFFFTLIAIEAAYAALDCAISSACITGLTMEVPGLGAQPCPSGEKSELATDDSRDPNVRHCFLPRQLKRKGFIRGDCPKQRRLLMRTTGKVAGLRITKNKLKEKVNKRTTWWRPLRDRCGRHNHKFHGYCFSRGYSFSWGGNFCDALGFGRYAAADLTKNRKIYIPRLCSTTPYGGPRRNFAKIFSNG